jgi:hypothetical protein
MELLRLRETDQREFAAVTEVAMDCHLAQSPRQEFYLVIGCRVASSSCAGRQKVN